MASKKVAYVDKEKCMACCICVIECPADAVEIKNGYFAEVDQELCTGCGTCAKYCPAGCISIVDRVNRREQRQDDSFSDIDHSYFIKSCNL